MKYINAMLISSLRKEYKPFRLFIFFLILLSSKISLSQVQEGSFEFEGLTRNYIVFLPQNYSSVSNMPIVFNLHGLGVSAQWTIDNINMNSVADTAGFIVVYPNGVNKSWQPYQPNINDVGFISALIDTLNNNYSINTNKVYSCGFSLGGGMSCLLACELYNKITAIASVAGGMIDTWKCNSDQVIPFLCAHGTADTNVPYSGVSGFYVAEKLVSYWANFNGCTLTDTTYLPDIDSTDGTTVEKIEYSKLNGNRLVEFYKINNGTHGWPPAGQSVGRNNDINLNVEIWNFFKVRSMQHEMDIIDHSNHIINHFILEQNYPNPFNPTTRITYSIARSDFVLLKVYDLLGREIQTLFSEFQKSGTYSINFDASNFSSGIYFYKLQVGSDFVEMKKMLFLR